MLGSNDDPMFCNDITGTADQEYTFDCEGSSLTLKADGNALPIINRTLDGLIAHSQAMETVR